MYGTSIVPTRGGLGAINFDTGGFLSQLSQLGLDWGQQQLMGDDDDNRPQQPQIIYVPQPAPPAPAGLFGGLPTWAIVVGALGLLWWLFKGK